MRGAGVAPAMPTKAPEPTKAAAPGGFGAAPTSAPAAPIQPPARSETYSVLAVGDKTFLFRNQTWTDTQYDPSKMTTTTRIAFNSDAYFALATNNPGAVKYLALGSRVIVVLNGVAYEITDNGTGATDVNAVPTTAPVTATPQARSIPNLPTSTTTTNSTAPTSSAPTNSMCGLGTLALLGSVWATAAMALRR